MAHVRITQAMLKQVESKIDRMRSVEIGKYTPADNTFNNEYPDINALTKEAERMAWEEAPHLQGQLPEGWCQVVREVSIQFLTESDDGTGLRCVGRGINSRLYVGNRNDKMTIPAGRGSINKELTAETRAKYPLLCEKVDALMAWGEKKKAITERYRDLTKQVLNVLEASKSLNAALKAVPQLALYCESSWIDAVNKKVTRAKKDSPDTDMPHIDVDMMVATAIAHRMGGRA